MTLERIEHKVFASEAPLEEMGQFGSALATTKLNTKDVAEIQALPAYTQGWGSAIISENNYPAMEEMNGVLNVMSYHTGYLYQEGIPTYSATQEYSVTSWVKDLAGEKVYKSLQGGNKGHDLTDPAWWMELKLGGGGSGFNLFDTKISDHILEGESAKGWALQGTYVNGVIYPSFYAKCLGEYNEATETEIVNGVTVKVSANGHKFFDIADKVAIDGFFNTMGSAWFYGVDIENERIFLPRDKYFAVTGGVMGNGMTLGLTDEANNFGLRFSTDNDYGAQVSSAGYGTNVGTLAQGDYPANGKTLGITTDATKSGIVLEANEDKYLYICVGNTIVNEELIDVSKVLSEAVLRSSLEEVQTVIETYVNGTSWYRIWSDGWCEQGGYYVPTATLGTITLLKSYKDTGYSITTGGSRNVDDNMYTPTVGVTKTISNFSIYCGSTVYRIYWQASGYLW